MLSFLLNLFGGAGDKGTIACMGLVWGICMCCLLYLVLTDKTLWQNSEVDESKRARPRARSSTKLRTVPWSQLWKLGVYEVTVMLISSMFFFVAAGQWCTILTRDYADDREMFADRMASWEANAMQGEQPRLPGDMRSDIFAAMLFTVFAMVIFLAGAWPMYKAYRTVVYGREAEGVSEGVVHDWTMSIVFMPARSVTYTYVPEGGQVPKRRMWKGLPGESWVENVYSKGTKIKVIYDEANPSYAVVPEFLGIQVRAVDDAVNKKAQ